MNSHRIRRCDRYTVSRGLLKTGKTAGWGMQRFGFAFQFLNFTTLVCLSLVLAGCVGNNYPELSSTQDPDATPYDYSIGTGDLLNIFVWGYPDLDESVPVRPDGKITTKLVEDVQASGRTPSELARDIEKSYATFVTSPVVTISLTEFSGSQSQQVKIVLAGGDARTIPYTNDLTLLDVIIEIGGLTEFADGNNAVLVRKDGEIPKNYSVRIDDLIRKGEMSANVYIRPGDIVLIPESRF